MTTIYGSIKVAAKSERISNSDCRYDNLGHVEITLKGRKYFKYLEVVYQKKTFYGIVPYGVTIDDLFFDGIMTCNTRLFSVCIGYGTKKEQVAECDQIDITQDSKVIKRMKASYYDEILFELDETYKGIGTDHVDTILEALRYKKILKDNNILQLVSKIDELQTQNNKLSDDNKALLLTNERNNNLSSDLADTITNLEEQVRDLFRERNAFKKDIKEAVQAAIDNIHH